MDSYGYVETFGLVTAIEAADAALKAADVTLTNCYIVKGGLVTVEVAGDVAAVTAAVEAATESAKRLGNFLSSNVIARVDAETKKILVKNGQEKKTEEIGNDSFEEETIEIKETEVTEIVKEAEDDKNSEVSQEIPKEVEKDEVSAAEKKLRKQYQEMKVVDLKIKVNNLKLDYTWNQIKGMNKKKLIEILLKNN